MEVWMRTDIAQESLARLGKPVEGIVENERKNGGIVIHRVHITTGEAAERIGKPIGAYLTFACGRIDRMDAEHRERLSRILSAELRGLAEKATGKRVDGDFSILIVGLGNAALTADAVGPATVERLTATRHLRTLEPELYRSLGCCAVSLLVPGVLAKSGTESAEAVAAAVNLSRPDLVIAIDALAAMDCDRLASTVQVNDAGIAPGSGIGNRRCAIDRATLGVPVLAVGIPTVVSSATLVWSALEQAGIGEPDDALRRVLETGRSFFVSPKESDEVTGRAASVLARAVSLAFLGELDVLLA